MIILLAICTSFMIGFMVTPVLIRIFFKMKLMDTPGGRKIHNGFIPSMGGIGFVLATFISILIWFQMDQLTEIRFFLAAFGLMFFVGLRDDLVNLTVLQKLTGQLVSAFLVIVMADIRLSSLYGFFGVYELPLAVSYLLSFFAIITLTNSFNLIDGLDGLAGTISLVTLTFLGWWFWEADMQSFAMFSMILAGGIMAFLIYNWHPAKIFMGDTGSLSLGFALSVLTILFIDTNGTMFSYEGFKFNAPIASGIALLIVPIYDTARIFTKRVLKGKSPMAPDKSHVHHFLLRMGLRQDKVTWALVLIKVAFISLIFACADYNDHVMIPVVVLMAVILGIRMDVFTLKRVKTIAQNSPTVLSKRKRSSATVNPETREKLLRKAAKMSDN